VYPHVSDCWSVSFSPWFEVFNSLQKTVKIANWSNEWSSIDHQPQTAIGDNRSYSPGLSAAWKIRISNTNIVPIRTSSKSKKSFSIFGKSIWVNIPSLFVCSFFRFFFFFFMKTYESPDVFFFYLSFSFRFSLSSLTFSFTSYLANTRK